MGMLELLLCLTIGAFLPVQSTIEEQVAKFSQGFIDTFLHFPAEGDIDIPYDTIFSSWQTGNPDFHMLAELPPHLIASKIQVLCNRSQLIVLVDKKSNGVLLNGEELQLGDGCYSNGDLENQLVFTYDFSLCGTNRVIRNGLEVFSNQLHFNPRKSFFSWWLTPFTMSISCAPKRLENNPPGFPLSMALPMMDDWSVAIKAMNPSWTSTAESNLYRRGQVVHLQVIAKPGPDQQPFIQSCFVSASPDPNTRPSQAVILNKGCTATLGSNHVMTTFVASSRRDAVNLILNTSYLNSEVYIHCSVLISDQGITPVSKFCNYNKIHSRWEELSGNVEVCSCCSSRCKSPSLKDLRVGHDARALISTGPFVIMDKELKARPLPSVPEPSDPSSTPGANSMQSDASGPGVTEYQASSTLEFASGAPSTQKDAIVSGVSSSHGYLEGNEIPEEPSAKNSPSRIENVVVLRRRPAARLALWVTGRVKATDAGLNEIISSPLQSDEALESQLSDTLPNDVPQSYPASTDQQLPLDPPTNEISRQGLNEVGSYAPMNVVPLLDGWPIPPHLENAPMNVVPLLDGWPIPPHLENAPMNVVPLLDGWPIPPHLETAPMNVVPLLDGWPIPPHLENAALLEESQRRQRRERSKMLHTTPQGGYKSLPVDDIVNDTNLHEHGLNLHRDEPSQRQADSVVAHNVGAAGFQSVIRSKLQFSKGVDGSQALSYEEEVARPLEGKPMTRRFGMDKVKKHQERGQRGLLLTFLDLIRRLDKAE